MAAVTTTFRGAGDVLDGSAPTVVVHPRRSALGTAWVWLLASVTWLAIGARTARLWLRAHPGLTGDAVAAALAVGGAASVFGWPGALWAAAACTLIGNHTYGRAR